jgi:hypothetical protein
MDNFAHLVIALPIQLIVARSCRSLIAGASAASAWAISREVTQAEYRWIELYGAGRRANMPWWGGLDLRVWQNIDPWLDWLGPTLLVFAIALMMRKVLKPSAFQ